MFDRLITQRVHDLILPWIHKGSIAIDATMGNGHDTLYLANAVGDKGSVYSFDIQEEAIEGTMRTLAGAYDGPIKKVLTVDDVTMTPGVQLIQASHACIDELPLEKGIDIALFNLGYLPGGDKALTTSVESTMIGLRSVGSHLNVQGVLSIVTYPGHDMGAIEDETIAGWLELLPKKQFEVLQLAYMNRKLAPKHYMVYRLR